MFVPREINLLGPTQVLTLQVSLLFRKMQDLNSVTKLHKIGNRGRLKINKV
jgi:hypothetical protein